jgi:hypothetical protein
MMTGNLLRANACLSQINLQEQSTYVGGQSGGGDACAGPLALPLQERRGMFNNHDEAQQVLVLVLVLVPLQFY